MALLLKHTMSPISIYLPHASKEPNNVSDTRYIQGDKDWYIYRRYKGCSVYTSCNNNEVCTVSDPDKDPFECSHSSPDLLFLSRTQRRRVACVNGSLVATSKDGLAYHSILALTWLPTHHLSLEVIFLLPWENNYNLCAFCMTITDT